MIAVTTTDLTDALTGVLKGPQSMRVLLDANVILV